MKMTQARKVLTAVVAVAVVGSASTVLADGAATNLDWSALQTVGTTAIGGVAPGAMAIFFALLAIGIAIAVIRKLVGRR